MGRYLADRLSRLPATSSLLVSVRGVGLLAGVELRLSDGAPAPDACFRVVKQLLARGIIALPDGDHGNVISLTPPLTIDQRQLGNALDVLAAVLRTA
jgi:4-aminobutyrate aminotransferase-like enzyme